MYFSRCAISLGFGTTKTKYSVVILRGKIMETTTTCSMFLKYFTHSSKPFLCFFETEGLLVNLGNPDFSINASH